MDEKELATLQETVNKLTSQNQTLSAEVQKIKTLESENQSLKTSLEKIKQDSEIQSFVVEFPDVPMDLIPSNLDMAGKKAYAVKLREFKSKAPSPSIQNPPKKDESQWSNAGNIQPSLDAAQQAAKDKAQKDRDELVRKGDSHSLVSNILNSNADMVRRIFKLAPAK